MQHVHRKLLSFLIPSHTRCFVKKLFLARVISKWIILWIYKTVKAIATFNSSKLTYLIFNQITWLDKGNYEIKDSSLKDE